MTLYMLIVVYMYVLINLSTVICMNTVMLAYLYTKYCIIRLQTCFVSKTKPYQCYVRHDIHVPVDVFHLFACIFVIVTQYNMYSTCTKDEYWFETSPIFHSTL